MLGGAVVTSTPVAGDELVWMERADGPRAAMWHPAAAPARDVALVICPPLGYEATCCQRALRHLAQASAAAGIAALRLAYHGTADSDGDDAQAARVATWRDDIAGAFDAARRRAGVSRVVLVGVRLGATLATLVAAGREDVDTVVAMAPVISGRSLARELRAFRKLAEVDLALPAGVTNGRRDGDEEVAGFLFTAETLAALAELDLGKLSLGPARVVLIARDDLAGGEGRLAEALRDIGTAVELVEEPGFAAMNQDPHKSVPPAALWRRIVDGAVARSGGRAASPPTPTPNSPATMRAASGGVRERFVRLGPARAAGRRARRRSCGSTPARSRGSGRAACTSRWRGAGRDAA
jgi:alpha/beta superfamily hydrolase